MGVRKRLDDRIRILLERGIRQRHRSMLVIVGDHGRDQVVNLHQVLHRSALTMTTSTETTTSSTTTTKSGGDLNNNSSSGSPSPPPPPLSKRVLWCYKKELGFSSHKKKRMKKLKRDQQRGLVGNEDGGDDAFELFVSHADVSWCYYRDTHRALGQTFGTLVLQDFEALTPNVLARTIETVQGGGLVIFLLKTVASLKQLYTMSMDVHQRFRTEAGGDVVPRFNERFLLSWARCHSCLVCDDELNVLPLSRRTLAGLGTYHQHSHNSTEDDSNGDLCGARDLHALKDSLLDTPHVGALVEAARTLDQARAILVIMEACSEGRSSASAATTGATTTSPTVAITAARGRGKSAALGLALAGCVSLGYSTIAVTSPDPDNVKAVFEFCSRGLDALHYKPHTDYTVTYRNDASRGGRDNNKNNNNNNHQTNSSSKCVVSIEIHKSHHRQLIQYLPPDCPDQFLTSEIVAIDEAAAIPLPMVRALMKPHRITLLSSTVNGYEGTGRALSLKLIHELRGSARRGQSDAVRQFEASASAGAGSHKGERKVHEHRWSAAADAASASASGESGGALREVELTTPIRYASNDPVEAWLNKLLCLDCGTSSLRLSGGAPAPAECELYSVDRDALFSYHKLSEAFLQKIMGLYTSAHYKNTPNDLQMLSDAPAHSLFCLLSPRAERDADKLPDVMAVVQVALEGGISRKSVEAQLARGHRSAGDLIPWTIAQQFGDAKFARLSGARIVRVAVHPHVQGMGYGSRALELLHRYYNGEMVSLMNEDDDEEGNDNEAVEDGASDSESDHDEGSGRNDEDHEESFAPGSGGLRGEALKPRKELPPLLLPLTEVEAPQLDWIGTSFGLTLQLHNFWSRRGMRMLYLRQTKNELTGEHSAIMIRALPRRAGFDESWLRLYLLDVRKRFLSLLSGAFRDMDVRLAVSVLENMADDSSLPDSSTSDARSATTVLSADELDYYMSPHDLKRLEQYGRNLCDHHLVTDLLPTVCRLYFTRRFGPEFNVSSVQAALLAGIGLQNRTVDNLTADLGLPSNQVLAMFNKAVRKISIALNGIVEAREKTSMMSNEKRKNAEAAVERMRDVTRRTFDEEAEEVAREADTLLNPPEARVLAPEILNDPELVQYVVKGTEEQWMTALGGGDVPGAASVRIESVREKRRNLTDDDIERENSVVDPKRPKSDKKRSKKGRMSR